MVYFDNAATTLKRPDCVVKSASEAMTTMTNAGRGAHTLSLNTSRMVYKARKALSSLINAESPLTISFMSNATEALNTAIKGLFNSGDEIITTVTEHNSVLRPLYLLEQQGVKIHYIQINEKGLLNYESIETLVNKNTKAFVLNHSSNVLGNVINLNFFTTLKEKYNLLLLLDASQTLGTIPVDVQKNKIDVLCFTGHKGLMGPQGTGGIYVKKGIKINPLKSGGSGTHSFDKFQPDKMPELLEAGTLNSHGIAGLLSAVNFIQENTVDKIHQKEIELLFYFYNKIKAIKEITIYGDFSSKYRTPILSLNILNLDSAYVSDILSQKYNILTRAGAHCAPLLHTSLGTKEQGAVRFSFGFYNTKEEIDYAVSSLKEIIKNEV